MMGGMQTQPADPTSPVLANAVVVAGFAVIFTTFVFDTPWSVAIGVAMVLAGGLWAGVSGTGFAGLADPVPGTPEPPAVEGARATREGAEGHPKPESGRVEQTDGRTA